MGDKSWEALDPRIRRTRKRLQRALEELMETRSFDEISVQVVADAATVNRATFYDHFTDKYSLLESTVASRFDEVLADSAVNFDDSYSVAIKGVVLTICNYLTRLQGPDTRRELEPHMESAIIASVRRVLLDALKRHPIPDSTSPEMLASAASWAIFGAAKEWSMMAERCQPEEGAEQVAALVMPILQRQQALQA